jgi:methionyl-tRNA synthetase
MLNRNFGGVVPGAPPSSPESKALIDEAVGAFASVGERYELCQFRNAQQEALRLAQSANRHLDERAPWRAVKDDLPHAAETLATAITTVNALKTLLHPILPFSTEKLHGLLGLTGRVTDGGWTFQPLAPGTQLAASAPLYTKLDIPEGEPA